MSTETVVNRTPETFGQKLERERLEDETRKVEREEQIETLIAQVASNTSAASTAKTVWDTPEGQAAIDRAVETAAEELTAPETPFSPEAELLSEGLKASAAGLIGLTRDPDLRVFKGQVVAAFKHLGLDTRKFFGV